MGLGVSADVKTNRTTCESVRLMIPHLSLSVGRERTRCCLSASVSFRCDRTRGGLGLNYKRRTTNYQLPSRRPDQEDGQVRFVKHFIGDAAEHQAVDAAT